MIDIDGAEILDILPYTMKDKYKALSLTLKHMRAAVMSRVSNAELWADIDNAPEAALDAMAAEIDALFYSSDMSADRKRALIKAAYTYNSRIGTVSSLTQLLSAAFGGGEVMEWHEYGGAPYRFKVNVTSKPPFSVTRLGYEMFINNLDIVKPKRAKLEAAVFTRSTVSSIPARIGIIKTYRKFTVPAGQVPDEERGYN